MNVLYCNTGNSNQKEAEFICLIDPDTCPICNFSLEPNFKIANRRTPKIVEALFRCTRVDCGCYFIAYYHYVGVQRNNHYFELETTRPNTLQTTEFSKDIAELSSSFCTIYNQSENAELYELDQVAGVGYRQEY